MATKDSKAPKKLPKKLTSINPNATSEEIENTIVKEMSAMSMSESASGGASASADLNKYQKMSDK